MTADGSAADAVACTGLTHAFGNTPAVDGLDLTVREGEVFGPVAADLRSDFTRLEAIPSGGIPRRSRCRSSSDPTPCTRWTSCPAGSLILSAT